MLSTVAVVAAAHESVTPVEGTIIGARSVPVKNLDNPILYSVPRLGRAALLSAAGQPRPASPASADTGRSPNTHSTGRKGADDHAWRAATTRS